MRLWHMHGWFACYVAPRAVLFFLLPGQDAWHLGRYVSEGQLSALAYARLVCWLRCTQRCFTYSVQALAVGSGTACAHCHMQARPRCTPLACSPFHQVHVSTSGVLTLGYVTNAGAGYWKVLNSWGSSWVSRVTSVFQRGKGGADACGLLAVLARAGSSGAGCVEDSCRPHFCSLRNSLSSRCFRVRKLWKSAVAVL